MARREAQQKEHEHEAEELRVALKERSEEAAESREKMRVYAAEVEELEGRLATIEDRQTAKLKEAEEQYQRELKSLRRTEASKSSYNRALSHLADFLSRPLASPAVYQEVPAGDLDPEIATVVNLALRKFCE